MRFRVGPFIIIVLNLVAAAVSRGDAVPRTGFVTLQFDDSRDYHYTRIFPKLQERGLRASFGYITEASALGFNHEPWKMQEIYRAGNEVQDHTTRHDYKWATHVDTLDDGVDQFIPYTFADVSEWDSLFERSHSILESLGIRAYGWNQPGGSGGPGSIPGHPEWTWMGSVNDSLYNLVASKYSYAVASDVFPNTAHLNLRGHNCPDRFPFFNVPHVTIDNMALADVKTGIADAAASGLWYLAVSHAADLVQVAKVESLIDWLADQPIEVLTCHEAVERVQSGVTAPLENQLPQASMLRDLDRNGRPDGFIGECVWDTLSAPPVGNTRCLRVYGNAEFYCYGPETGLSALSFWVKSATPAGAQVTVVCAKVDFDWRDLGDSWTTVGCSNQWAKIDTLGHPSLLMDVSGEVDRIRFIIEADSSRPVIFAYPEMMHVTGDPAGTRGSTGGRAQPGLVVTPNPIRMGEQVRIRSTEPAVRMGLYDVLGRCLPTRFFSSDKEGLLLNTSDLTPGIFFLEDSSGSGRCAKLVVLR